LILLDLKRQTEHQKKAKFASLVQLILRGSAAISNLAPLGKVIIKDSDSSSFDIGSSTMVIFLNFSDFFNDFNR
jgi:hypothetical protein